jgi:hypothetical protein
MVRGQAPRVALLVHLGEKRTYPFCSQMAKVEPGEVASST